jgi:hypothetical protein
MSTTVVTAFYRFEKSKHTYGEYLDWIRNFFSFTTSPVVCYCENAAVLRAFQVHPNVTFVELPFIGSYTLTSPEWVERWSKQHEIDPEKDIHCPELYMIWALKQEFVARAIEANHYGSTHYVWCDIGCFRSPQNFPDGCRFAERTPEIVQPGKTLILSIDDGRHYGGGVLAGDIDSWNTFTRNFMETLEIFHKSGRFYGKDQDLYRYMIESCPLNFTIVEAKLWGDNNTAGKTSCVWFYMTRLLSII